MFVEEVDEQAQKERGKTTLCKKSGLNYGLSDTEAEQLIRHISPHLNEILRPLLRVDNYDEAILP